MGLKRTLLRPVAFVAGRHARRQYNAFLAAHRRTAEVQERFLLRLLRMHEETEFGRKHGFAKIRSVDDFRKAVPINEYDSLKPYVDKVLQGRTTALLPADQPPLMFSMTSGTTGSPKYIPVTERFATEMRRGWNIWGRAAFDQHKEAWLRPLLQVTSRMREENSPTGLPCGAVSGLLSLRQKRVVRRMYAAPAQAALIDDHESRYYTIMRCAIPRDVSFITTANPSTTIKLIDIANRHADRLVEDIATGQLRPPSPLPAEVREQFRFRPNKPLAERLRSALRNEGRLLPRHFWNLAFLGNWTGGTLWLYQPRLRELFGDVPVRDIGLLASEGRFTIPMEANSPGGIAEITGNFLEFIPAGNHGQASALTVTAEQTEVGQEYFLVFSNYTGLWRYNLDDRVRVVDRFGGSPVLEFLCRGKNTANMTGEKLTERQVVEAMARACPEASIFSLQGRFAQTPHYLLRIGGSDRHKAEALAQALDDELARQNVEYASKRESGRLGPVQVQLEQPGTLEREEQDLIRTRRGRAEQYKHQYLLTDVINEACDASQVRE
ncbi:MAG: GH3 auxin-responsive promoter family protein [Phycisphaerae bacterium]